MNFCWNPLFVCMEEITIGKNAIYVNGFFILESNKMVHEQKILLIFYI